VAVTEVPSANSGHCSAISDAVATLWEPATQCRTCSALLQPPCCQLPIPPSNFPLRRALEWHGHDPRKRLYPRPGQDPGLQDPRNVVTPRLEDGTPYSNDHAACWSYRDTGVISARPRTTPSMLELQCSTTAPPRFGEKTTTSTIFCACTPPLPVPIKGGGGLSLMGMDPSGRTQHSALLTEHIHSSKPRYWHSAQSTPPLAETWELPSISRLACTTYYRHPRCKTVQCSCTPLCWTYDPPRPESG